MTGQVGAVWCELLGQGLGMSGRVGAVRAGKGRVVGLARSRSGRGRHVGSGGHGLARVRLG